MKKFFSLFAFLLLLLPTLLAQISTAGLPYSFSISNSERIKLKPIDTLVLSPVDLQKIKEQDAKEDEIQDIPWRFGIAKEVNLGLNESGTWEVLPNGDRLWRQSIHSPNAVSLNINYDQFYMPNGAQLFLYSNKKKLLGAFSKINNKKDSLFATRPIMGDIVTLEYYEPFDVIGEGVLHINQVVHGYRSVLGHLKSFGSSGPCNININCPEGAKWQVDKRAVAMITVSSNTRICTGTLLNNVRQDSTPYFLSAGHCNIPPNGIFIFNYESELCNPSTDGHLNHSITGAELKATHVDSDFALLELSMTPPDSFNVFYAGWSAVEENPLATTVIHHPLGDVKKFSFDLDSAISSGYYNSGRKNYWEILGWDLGTTEVASSGSALFDQNHKVVGQLRGGDAKCGNKKSDWFGKFSRSWAAQPDSFAQLQFWLDPDNTGLLTINGLDTDTAQFTVDAEILFIEQIPNFHCDTLLEPLIVFRNNGNDTLKTLKINYKINNSNYVSLNWTGSLPRFGMEKFSLNQLSFTTGLHKLTVAVAAPNSIPDQNTFNDTLSILLQTTSNPSYLNMIIKTDDYGSETTWNITDPISKNKLYTGGPYEDISNGKIYSDTLCLYDTCFNFTIMDSRDDGFNGSFGNGYYLLKDLKGDTLLFGDNFTGTSQSANFCLDLISSIQSYENKNTLLSIFPNPINDRNFKIKTDIIPMQIYLLNIQGKMVQKWESPHLQSSYFIDKKIAEGVFILSVTDKEKNVYHKKIIIQ